jgi:hypothetical protein
MTITLNSELEQGLSDRAKELGLPPEELVRRAVAWFVQIDPALQVELQEWQQRTWNAWDMVEESPK